MRLVCESSSWVLTFCSYPFLFPLLIPSSTELWNCSLKQPEGFDRRWRNSCFRFRLCSVSLKQAKSIHGDAECSCYRPIYWWVKHSWGQGARLQSSSPQWRMHKGRCKRHHESIWFESSPRINPKLQSQRKLPHKAWDPLCVKESKLEGLRSSLWVLETYLQHLETCL